MIIWVEKLRAKSSDLNKDDDQIAGEKALLVVYVSISGKYEASLNNLGMIFINCDRFMREWKLLLAQLIEAYNQSEVILDSRKALLQKEQLRKLHDGIKGKGWLYA